MKSIGIYGGSFDPIHIGHLLLADSAREELGLEKVIFVPALQSPLKGHLPLMTAKDRLSMIQLAIEDNQYFTFSEVELKRKPPSYTIDTLLFFRQVFPEHMLYLLMGQDSLSEFIYWHQFQKILQLVRIAVGARPGFTKTLPHPLQEYKDQSTKSQGVFFFRNLMVDISSSEIRKRIKQGQSVRYFLPPKVYNYIIERKIYHH